MADKLTISLQISGILYLVLATLMFMTVSYWRIHSKAGWPGWTILVPFYNMYIDLKIAGKPGWWLIFFFLPLIQLPFMLLMYIGMAANFGKGALFAFGMFMLPFPFWPILAFDGSEYIGDNIE